MNIVSYLAPRGRTLLGKTVVHVGAHFGEEAEKYERWGAARVIWVEAEPTCFARLQTHIAQVQAAPRPWFPRLMGQAKCTHLCLQALAGDSEDKTAEFRIYNNAGSSNSIFALHDNAKAKFTTLEETGEIVRLPMRLLDKVLEDAGVVLGDIDALVVDVQGAELLVLKGAERLLKTLRLLETEVSQIPIYEGGVLLSELEPWLKARGLVRRTKVKRDHMDAIFTRVA